MLKLDSFDLLAKLEFSIKCGDQPLDQYNIVEWIVEHWRNAGRKCNIVTRIWVTFCLQSTVIDAKSPLLEINEHIGTCQSNGLGFQVIAAVAIPSKFSSLQPENDWSHLDDETYWNKAEVYQEHSRMIKSAVAIGLKAPTEQFQWSLFRVHAEFYTELAMILNDHNSTTNPFWHLNDAIRFTCRFPCCIIS